MIFKNFTVSQMSPSSPVLLLLISLEELSILIIFFFFPNLSPCRHFKPSINQRKGREIVANSEGKGGEGGAEFSVVARKADASNASAPPRIGWEEKNHQMDLVLHSL